MVSRKHDRKRVSSAKKPSVSPSISPESLQTQKFAPSKIVSTPG